MSRSVLSRVGSVKIEIRSIANWTRRWDRSGAEVGKSTGRPKTPATVIEIAITIAILSAREKAVGRFFERAARGSRPRFPCSFVCSQITGQNRPVSLPHLFADGNMRVDDDRLGIIYRIDSIGFVRSDSGI